MWLVVGGRDPATVPLHDPGRDRQTEASPAAGRASGPIEPIEDAGQVLGSYPRAFVLHHEDRVAGFRSHANADLAAARCMAQSVIDEDADELAQSRRIADDLGRHRVDHEPDAAVR